MKNKSPFKSFILIIICLLLVYGKSYSQTLPSIIIDGTPSLVTENYKFPYWLNAGQTLDKGNKVNSISVLQYGVSAATGGGNDLLFESVISVTSLQTVPANKVWKIEGVSFDLTAGTIGVTGATGPTGLTGPTGATGATGLSAASLTGIVTLTSTASNSVYTPTPGTTMIEILVIGGGGAGGGSTSNAYYNGGGASGCFLKKLITNFSGTATYQCGAGGTGGSGNGGSGSPTTFTYGGTTYTANGGGGGTGGTGTTFFAGGSPGSAPTNGDINGGGMAGAYGMSSPNVSGFGGSSILGGGGAPRYSDGNGNPGTSYGAGGGGSASASGPRNGGDGKQGAIIIYEYK